MHGGIALSLTGLKDTSDYWTLQQLRYVDRDYAISLIDQAFDTWPQYRRGTATPDDIDEISRWKINEFENKRLADVIREDLPSHLAAHLPEFPIEVRVYCMIRPQGDYDFDAEAYPIRQNAFKDDCLKVESRDPSGTFAPIAADLGDLTLPDTIPIPPDLAESMTEAAPGNRPLIVLGYDASLRPLTSKNEQGEPEKLRLVLDVTSNYDIYSPGDIEVPIASLASR